MAWAPYLRQAPCLPRAWFGYRCALVFGLCLHRRWCCNPVDPLGDDGNSFEGNSRLLLKHSEEAVGPPGVVLSPGRD